MAQYNPPSQNLPIFDSGLFGGTNQTSGGVPSGDFLNFPNAQGDENLLGITVADSATFNADSTFNDVVEINNDTTFSTNIIMSGTYLTNYIEFPDGTQQFSASSGSGDALLDGGTSSAPQTFTGYNEFDNANGRITLGNTTNTTKIKLESDETNNDQLNINGQVSIGNLSNGNTVLLNSDTTTTDQLDIQGTLQVYGAGWPIELAGYGNSTSGVYGLQVSGGGLRLGSNGGTPGSSTYVQLACLDADDNQLYVAGSIQLSNSTLSGTNVTISSGTVGLVISSGIQVGGNCNLVNTVSSVQSTSTLSQSSTVAETVVCSGNLQLSGGTTNRTISLNYSGQDNIEIYQNYPGNLECNSGITISPNIESYPSNTNRITLYADETTNNQLDVEGNLLTTGNITLGSGSTTGASLTFGDGSVQTTAYTGAIPSGTASLTAGTSSSPQTFTGYNKINLLQYNGMSCPQKVVSNSVTSSTNGSIWTFNVGTLTTSYGKAISFSISTNNNNPSQPLAVGAYVTDSTGILIGTGYGVNQPFTISGVSGSFSAYVLYMTNFTNVSSWYFLTEVASTGAIYNCYVNDNNYYANNNIQLTMYISPTAVI